jgi:hypothetical protein
MTAQAALPAPFADLSCYVRDWALPSEKARFEKRVASPLAEVRAFNDAVYARIDDIIVYLNRFPLDAIPPDAQTLLTLARAYMETSHPVDLGWSTTDLEDAFPSARFQFLAPSC